MKKVYLTLIGLLGLHLFFLSSLVFTAWPEMLSFPYFVNHGFRLYKDTIHVYPPLLTYILSAVYWIFGYKLEVLKAVTWVVILTSDLLVFSIVKKITSKNWLAVIGVLIYISIQPFWEGNMLWYDLTLVPFVLAGIYYSLDKKWLLAGLFFALGALVKQTALMYLGFGALYVVYKERSVGKAILKFIVLPGLLFLLLTLKLYVDNSLIDFLNWSFVYPFTYWSKIPGYVQMMPDWHQIKRLLWLLFPLCIAIIFSWRSLRKNIHLGFLSVLFVLSLVSVYPRFSFFHLQLSLSIFVVILLSLLSVTEGRLLKIVIGLWIFTAVLNVILHITWSGYWSESSINFADKDDIRLAQLINQNTNKDDKIFLLGLHSGLYVLADRLPVKRWTDNFAWYLEIPNVQDEIIRRWQENPPDKIFWKDPLPGNWFDLGSYQPIKITDWIRLNYNKKQEVESGIWLWEKKQ